MNTLQTEWWTVGIPPEWWAEQVEDIVVIGDRDEVGAIEISSLHREQGDFSVAEVTAIARDNAEQPCDWASVSAGDFEGVCCGYLEADSAVREWYLACGGLLLFVTYSCDPDNRGMDDAAVDEILDTLAASPAAS